MAEAGVSLNDFFAKKKKPKFKGINLNSGPASDKAADKNAKPKDDNEEGWQEEQVVASTIGKVEVAGNLNRTEDKKEEEDNSAPAWGKLKGQQKLDERDQKRFPSLKGPGSNINIDDGSNAKVNIKTSKNAFQDLANEEDDDSDKETKRPTEIKPAMVQKKKGEFTKAAIQREVNKYTDKPDKKKKKKKDNSDDEEEEDEEESEEEEEDEETALAKAAAKAEASKAKAKAASAKKKADKEKQAEEAAEESDPDDVKIVADPTASKAKYENRKKPFPAKDLPRFDVAEEKKVKPSQATAAGGKKGKKKNLRGDDEDDGKSKLKYLSESD